jgi:hypothetical protein
MKAIVFIKAAFIGFFCSTAVQAAPTKSAAEAWGQDFRRVRDKATDALVLRDAVGQPRAAMRTQIDQLAQRGAKMWGESSDCTRAAQSLLIAFDGTGSVMRGGDFAATSLLTRQAFESGQNWASCRDVIDATK